VFDTYGRASQAQRLSTEDLAQPAGLADLGQQSPLPESGQDPKLMDRFVEQLSQGQDQDTVTGTVTVLDAWTTLGGILEYGEGDQTSCFLLARDKSHPDGNIWPVTIYPLRGCEVVFQHLASRTPFDDIQLREELRQRLTGIPGIDLPAAKIELRPSFPLPVLSDPAAREAFIDTLKWFFDKATAR
jgi:hypothetical protein